MRGAFGSMTVGGQRIEVKAFDVTADKRTPTDGEALLAAILREPDEDTPRLVYADWLDENAGLVPCSGHGCRGGQVYGQRQCSDGIVRNAWGDCPQCRGTGRVSDGRRERAEFIRVQCVIHAEQAAQGSREFWSALRDKHRNCGHLSGRGGCSPWCRAAQREENLWNFGQPGGHWSIDDPLPFAHCIRCIDWESISTSTSTHDPIAIYRRGFVDQITCRADAWLAHADAVLAAHPVRRVKLTTWPGERSGWPTGVEFLSDGHVCYPAWPGVKFAPPSLRY